MISAPAWLTRDNPIARYTRWLHTQWPAGKPEKLPVVREDGSTRVPGLYVVGDLSGIPLLKLSVNGGTNVAARIADEIPASERATKDDEILDIAIVGGGTAGFSAAKEAERLGLRACVFEASEPFSTIVNFPKGKPIYTYPTDLGLEGELEFHEKSEVKEGLLEDLREQTVDAGLRWVKGRAQHVKRSGGGFEIAIPDRVTFDDDTNPKGLDWLENATTIPAKRVIVAIGRSGNYRKLNVPGEERNKVYNRLHDPADFCGQNVLIVGGGDSALESAIALATCGADVTLSYRRDDFSRPKPDNREKILAIAENPEASRSVGLEQSSDPRQSPSTGTPRNAPDVRGSLTLMMSSQVKEIRDDEVDISDNDGEVRTLPNDSVFAMIGREPPLDFFRRSGVPIRGEKNRVFWTSMAAFLLVLTWTYHWKATYAIPFGLADWFNSNLAIDTSAIWNTIQENVGGALADRSTLVGTIANSMESRSFYYTFLYASAVVGFGIDRIIRRKTPYVRLQTSALMAIQVIPLFLLPEIILPFLDANGVFNGGAGKWIAETFFPNDSWWRAYGLILAWPLMVWNWFTDDPLWGWLILGSIQTFVLIPGMIYFWGKGAYCGWICSCGALAETMGDRHREKMPHGPVWNRVNMLGQIFLAFAVILMFLRIVSWAVPGDDRVGDAFNYLARGDGIPVLNYAWMVDLLWAGILGVGLYFWFSGRVWCRFACPLAALMHIYHRFSRFRILSEKSKCISCNVCTNVCHQGIDVMSFANKGEPMADPQCVRCSACVQSCPTGVLYFGQVDKDDNEIYRDPDWLSASPVRMRETKASLTVNGKKPKKSKKRQPAVA